MRFFSLFLLLLVFTVVYAQDTGGTTSPAAPTDTTAPAPAAPAPAAPASPTDTTTTPAAPTDTTAPAPAAPASPTDTTTTPAAPTDTTAPAPAAPAPAAPASPTDTTTTPAAPSPAAGSETGSADLLAEVERLGAKLEEANAVIDDLRAQANDLRDKAAASDAAAKAAQARADSLADKAAQADKLAAEADDLRAKAAELEAKIADMEKQKENITTKMLSFGDLKLDPADYPTVLVTGFASAEKRMGSWKIAGGQADQTDPRQFFSRLTFPVVQSATPTLYSFDVRAGAKGWVGAGLHFFSASVKKPQGYGEGRSLLVWLTRDAKIRGGPQTYLQLYRSDDDVNMERVLDALIKEGVADWHHLDLLYDPGSEFLVVAIDGSVRAAYRTFFGIGAGVSVSLRTLGEGVSFKNFTVRR